MGVIRCESESLFFAGSSLSPLAMFFRKLEFSGWHVHDYIRGPRVI